MFFKSDKIVDRIKNKDRDLEEELLKELTFLNESERFAFINELITSTDSLVRRFGLSLMQKLNWNNHNLLVFMKKGLLLKNPSEIKYWYMAIAPQLGAKPILNLIEQYIEEDSDVVQRAWYYLDIMIRSKFTNYVNQLETIKNKFREKLDKEIWDVN